MKVKKIMSSDYLEETLDFSKQDVYQPTNFDVVPKKREMMAPHDILWLRKRLSNDSLVAG